MFASYLEFWRWLVDSGQLSPPEENEVLFSISKFRIIGEPQWD